MKKISLILLISSITILSQNNGYSAKEYSELGKQALDSKNEIVARTYLEQALDLEPTNFNAHYYLALTEYYANNGTTSKKHIAECLKQRPTDLALVQTAATILNSIGNFDAALRYFELLLDSNPRNTQTRTKLLPLYLRNMDWHYAEKLCRVNDLWWYDSDIKDKTVLLDLTSQWNGLGDVLQIVRYAKHLYQAGAIVTVKVRQELISLLSACPYISSLLPANAPIQKTDLSFQLTTDRCVLRMVDTLYQPAKEVPYLHASQERIKKWQPSFWTDTAFKVGICWQSTKMRDYFSNRIIPGPRAFDPSLLKPLLSLKNVSFYSLQKGENGPLEQLQKEGFALFSFELFDTDGAFMDTAAIMKHLDLIITVDTSIAHLAGGLGVPVWVMLPHAADFRWFSDRSDSPLYPTMKLFRQPIQNEWQPVIHQVKDELEKMIRA